MCIYTNVRNNSKFRANSDVGSCKANTPVTKVIKATILAILNIIPANLWGCSET